MDIIRPYLTFSNVSSLVALILIIIGAIGLKVIRNKPSSKDFELERQMEEHEREEKRRAKEAKELDDFMAGSEDDYDD